LKNAYKLGLLGRGLGFVRKQVLGLEIAAHGLFCGLRGRLGSFLHGRLKRAQLRLRGTAEVYCVLIGSA
jgi:hypothetical protein